MRAGADPSLQRVVAALGIAQIVSWGTLFYTIAVLGPPMRAELGIGDVMLFGSFTAGLAVSGLLSPLVGRAIDARGGRRVLVIGSWLSALAMATLALAQGRWSMLAGWLLAGVAMSAVLYDPAFATLHQWAGTSYRRCVTALTLFGGFASTVFWPLSQWLQEAWGWRVAFLVYAGLHLALCLPLHVFGVPRGVGSGRPSAADGAQAPAPAHGPVFVWLALALALASFLSSALSAHLIGFLTASGLSVRDAVTVGAIVGPMQVAGRAMEFAFFRRLQPVAVGALAFAVLAAALLLFTQVHGVLALALAFAIPYGWSNGVMTIVRGTVPAVLFGGHGYGALLGRLAQPQFVARASAPMAIALLLVQEGGGAAAPWMLAAFSALALLAYGRALAAARAAGAAPG
jgi:MFS family permease